jgi:Zn-dependent peptidase ImmA (M78 family)
MKKWLLNIENKAKKLLEEFGYNGAPFAVDVRAFANFHGFQVKFFESNPLELNLESISGALIVQNGNKTIGIKKFESDERIRFTIAHELGHYFLNHGIKDGIKLDTYTLFRNDNSSTGEKIEEIQANAFAAALLMPSEYLVKEFEEEVTNTFDDLKIIQSLATKFKVSQISMSYRLNRLQLLETDNYIF